MKKTILLLSAVLSLGLAQAQTNNTIDRTITSTGLAEKEVTPDIINVSVTIREYNDKKNNKIDIETIRHQFLDAAKSVGLTDKDVTVQSFSGWNSNPIIYKKNKKANPDLKASINYLVKLNSVDQMNQLQSLLDDNATSYFGVSSYDYSKKEALKDSLKVVAIKKAKSEAEMLTSAIGEVLGHAESINVTSNDGNYIQPRVYAPMMMKAAVAGSSAESDALNVDFKKIKYSESIEVKFQLK